MKALDMDSIDCILAGPRREEYEDLLGLLRANASREGEYAERLAAEMAAGCLGQDHLWQDMGLEDRAALSEIISAYFRPLYDRNTKDMKWKKFFYRQICESEGFYLCKSPSCGECADYIKCFGPEE